MNILYNLRQNLDIVIPSLLLMLMSNIVLRSIAPFLFPQYYIYIASGIFFFLLFSHFDFDIVRLFAPHLYVFCIILLILPIFIGEVTRGAVRWIPLGPITLQPTELVRPFLILFFAQYLVGKKITWLLGLKASVLIALPLFLILIQPSLGVMILTAAAIGGIILSLEYNKKILLGILGLGFVIVPLTWFLLASYQKDRILAFIDPSLDPSGIGYNSIQSMISVGSGMLTGRGLGGGVQTQLLFLPERHTDFIFASISEELGFVGAMLLLVALFFLLFRITTVLENAKNPVARAFATGAFLTLTLQVVVHVGMNMSLFTITG